MKTKSILLAITMLFAFQFSHSQDAEAGEDIKIIEEDVLVEGVVMDMDNKPIKGVAIYVDSVKTRVKTNRKGEFQMMLKPSIKEVSAFSKFYGMHTLAYTKDQKFSFVFPKDYKVISEKELAELGYSTKTPKKPKKAPKDYSKYLDVYQLLVAEFPGVLVTGQTIRLRGTASNSLNSGQEPLIIVDDTQVGSGALSTMLPQDIKSVRIIRDEGASLYGARGANGVIFIRMKNSN